MKEEKEFSKIVEDSLKVVDDIFKKDYSYKEPTDFGKLIERQQNQIHIIKQAYENEIHSLAEKLEQKDLYIKTLQQIMEKIKLENNELKKEKVKKKSKKQVPK